ncbi:MAG: histidine kinase [Clostridiaceae bacterium]|nr:histidine kinase [Clostridiaceae bacterium]
MSNNVIRKIRGKITAKKSIIRTALYIALIVVLCAFIYITYIEYKKAVVERQQQQMLGISKSISRSIEVFVNDVTSSMKVVALDEESIGDLSNADKDKVVSVYKQKLKSYYDAEDKSIDVVYFLDVDGKEISKYPDEADNIDDKSKDDIEAAIKTQKSYIGKAYFNKEKDYFILNIYEPVFYKNKLKGIMAVSINLNTIYNKLISPVKTGEKGYVMVKDEDGTIMMHPVKEQIGMDVIDTRKQVFPNLDYSELEVLIKNQLTGEEGTALYHSYWWGDNVLKKVLKLNAYTPAKLGSHFWIIAVTMSYDEIQGPINSFLSKSIIIVLLITIIISILISALAKVKKNKKELEKETKYLKMLNESSEKLRKEEAELYHSNKLKMIGTFSGGIAHDINNLLTPILGYSELMLMSLSKESEYFDEVEEIHKASQKGKELIEQILVFSRGDSEIIKVEPIDINQVTIDTLKLLKAFLPKNVLVKENIQQQCGYVNANFTQIHQVIFNLCTNAYQSIKESKGTIEVSLRTVNYSEENEKLQLSKEKKYVLLTVKDTGCGMDEETKEKIFDPFFTTKEVGKGTGLGLFVAENIIHKYEGKISVESKLGQGSCFSVYLPLIDSIAEKEEYEEINDTTIDNKRIMVVDDNEEVLKLLKKDLELLGFEVFSEINSLNALEIFKKDYNKFDLILTDYMMPDLKGYELAEGIKKIKSNIPVILMTGHMDIDKNNIKKEFVDGWISKPIEISRLAEVIKIVLKKYE